MRYKFWYSFLPFFLFLFFLLLISPRFSEAKIGVGVGSGKIRVDEVLKAGTIYELPAINVINTGDETMNYEVTVTFLEGQKEIRPQVKWFDFSPATFSLGPGEIRSVKITLNLPLKTVPGDYFAYLEARPVVKNATGVSSVSIAAAAKLYFSVAPSNLGEAIYYKFISWWHLHEPWTNRGLVVVAILMVIIFVRKNLNFQITMKRPK